MCGLGSTDLDNKQRSSGTMEGKADGLWYAGGRGSNYTGVGYEKK